MDVWLTFILTLIVGTVLAIFPGFLLFKVSRFSIQDSILFAFPASIAIYVISGIIGYQFGLKGAGWLFGISLAITLLIVILIMLFHFFIKSRKQQRAQPQSKEIIIKKPHRFSIAKNQTKSRIEWLQIVLCLCINIAVMFLVFFSILDSPEMVFTFGDNDFHVTIIKSMIDSGDYSTLSVSQYPTDLPSEQNPFDASTSYYPAGYHIFTALIAAPFGASAPLAENAANFLITSIIFPLGTLALLRSIFDNKWIVFIGAFTVCACVAYPLRPLIVHQIYPNVAAFACIPSTIALFYTAFNPNKRIRSRAKYLISFIISIIGVGTLHPNAVIASGIFCFSILAASAIPGFIYKTKTTLPIKRLTVVLSILIFTTLFVIVWIFALDLPALQNTTNFIWEWTISPLIGILSVGTLGLKMMSPNFMLAIMMLIGFIYCIKRKKYWWVILNALICMTVFYFNVVGSFEIKRLFAGFWYTDPERTSALVAIAVIPLTACGLYSTIRFFLSIALRFGRKRSHPLHSRYILQKSTKIVIVSACIAVFMALNYMPNLLHIPIRGIGELSSFSATRGLVYEWSKPTDSHNLYTSEEQDFVSKALEEAGKESLIINMPYDGSLYSYAFDNANVYYKSHVDGKDDTNSQLIRTQLDQIANNEAVENAVDEIGARYVLKLHLDPDSNNDRNQWTPEAWTGLNNITDETPGFEVVLSDDDMRLYKIL